GACVQPANPVLHVIEGGQHEDGSPAAAVAHLVTDGKPIGIREHHVQHDRVKARLLRPPQCFRPVGGHRDRERLLLQAAPQQTPDLRVVLDHEHPHCPITCYHRTRARAGLTRYQRNTSTSCRTSVSPLTASSLTTPRPRT